KVAHRCAAPVILGSLEPLRPGGVFMGGGNALSRSHLREKHRMTQIAPNASYLVIEDRLDAVGQKYRGQRIVRGAMLWVAGAVVATMAATLAAHFIGQSSWTK